MDKLDTYFANIGFNNSTSEKVAERFQQKIFNKGDYFVTEGKTTLQIGFVADGQFQYYATTTQGEEKTTYIALQNSFIASLLSYLTETPARENIRALTNATLWTIDKKNIIDLQNEIPEFKNFYIQLVEWQLCCIDKSKFDFITLTAEQRYEKLLKEEPELLQQVPLQYLASMLGITPRHLSRLRKNV